MISTTNEGVKYRRPKLSRDLNLCGGGRPRPPQLRHELESTGDGKAAGLRAGATSGMARNNTLMGGVTERPARPGERERLAGLVVRIHARRGAGSQAGGLPSPPHFRTSAAEMRRSNAVTADASRPTSMVARGKSPARAESSSMTERSTDGSPSKLLTAPFIVCAAR